MNLEEYRRKIDRLIRGESATKFMLNGSEEHAAIIVERMFAHAETEMVILTRRLDPAIYADEAVLAQAESFASDPQAKTRIIVEDISDASLAMHGMTRLAALPNVEVRRLPASISKGLRFNYSVMDRRGYRFEDDKNEVNASVRFDDSEFAREAASYFDNLWDASQETTPTAAEGRA